MNKITLNVFIIMLLTINAFGCSTSGKPTSGTIDKKSEAVSSSSKKENDSDPFPKKNIRFIVPVSPGGGFDTVSRRFVRFWEKELPNNSKVIVENKPGGEWAIGLTEIYKAQPDGYTVGIINLPGNITDQLLGKAKFDLTKYVPIGKISEQIYVLAVSKKSGIKNINDYKNAKEIKGGVAGLSSTAGIGSLIVSDKLGIKYSYVPHDGSNEAVLSAIRGTVDSVLYPFSTLKKHIIDSKDLIPIMVFAKERLPLLPDIPTAVELGYPGLLDIVLLHRVVVAPPGTPDHIVKILRDSFAKAVQNSEFKQQMIQEDGTFNPADADTAKKIIEASIKEFQPYIELIKKHRQ